METGDQPEGEGDIGQDLAEGHPSAVGPTNREGHGQHQVKQGCDPKKTADKKNPAESGLRAAGKITEANGTQIHLAGGAQAANIFWQAFGDVTLGTTAHFEGVIMAQTSISLGTGASINGRLLAQTAVTLDANTVTAPITIINPVTLVSAATATGIFTEAAGQSVDLETETITVPMSGNMRFYRIIADTVFTITGITISDGNVVITYK